jgi:hypothetical protein
VRNDEVTTHEVVNSSANPYATNEGMETFNGYGSYLSHDLIIQALHDQDCKP